MNQRFELQQLKDGSQLKGVQEQTRRHHDDVPSAQDPDTEALARLGKKQVLRRNFGFVSILGFSCTVLFTWEGSTIVFGTAFDNGGLGGLVYQFILAWIGTLSTFISLGELASMAPTAGGQYHWVALLAPYSTRRFLSYITGWMTCFSWLSALTTNTYINPAVLQGIISFAQPGYEPRPWHLLLMSWAFISLCLFFTTVVNKKLPMVETLFLVCHVLGFFGILIPLVYLAPTQTASEAFATFTSSGYPTYGLSFIVGTINLVGAFLGADAAVHMSEEITNPSVVVPKAIAYSVLVNGCLGFAMTIALVFSSVDPMNIKEYTEKYNFPFIGTFQLVFDSPPATAGLGSLLFILGFSGTLSTFASTSRTIWSFARDMGLPFSDVIQKISPRAQIPIWSLVITFVIPSLLQFIALGSSVALNDFLSLITVGFFSTYLLSIGLLLYRRLRGDILEPHDAKPGVVYNKEEERFVLVWGPWRLRGWLGIANNIFSCIYLLVLWFFAFWPPATPVTTATMTYSSLLWGAAVLFSASYYFVWGRRRYKGPIVEVTVPSH